MDADEANKKLEIIAKQVITPDFLYSLKIGGIFLCLISIVMYYQQWYTPELLSIFFIGGLILVFLEHYVKKNFEWVEGSEKE